MKRHILKSNGDAPAPEVSYVVPTKRQFHKDRHDKGITWKQVYGTKKCVVCKKHFEENDEYVIANFSVKKFGCRHKTCIPKEPKPLKVNGK